MIGGRHIVAALALVAGVAAIVLVPDQRAVGLGFLIITGVEAAVFVAVYGLRSGWWSTILGRAMMAKAVAFLALVSWIVFSWYAKDFPYRDFIRQFFYLGLALAWMWMVMTVWRFQQAERAGAPLESLEE